MRVCPTCSQEIPNGLQVRVDTAARTAIVDGQPIRLTKQRAEVLAALVEKMPGVVRYAALEEVLRPSYAPEPLADPARSLSVAITMIRRVCRGTRLRIENVRGIGFRAYLEEPDACR